VRRVLGEIGFGTHDLMNPILRVLQWRIRDAIEVIDIKRIAINDAELLGETSSGSAQCHNRPRSYSANPNEERIELKRLELGAHLCCRIVPDREEPELRDEASSKGPVRVCVSEENREHFSGSNARSRESADWIAIARGFCEFADAENPACSIGHEVRNVCACTDRHDDAVTRRLIWKIVYIELKSSGDTVEKRFWSVEAHGANKRLESHEQVDQLCCKKLPCRAGIVRKAEDHLSATGPGDDIPRKPESLKLETGSVFLRIKALQIAWGKSSLQST
jgi:hypothetical protein